MKDECYFVVSRYNEDVSWLSDYNNGYVIYNKGEDNIFTGEILKRDNFGGNQFDICHYIYSNYDSLPDTIAFVQGDPFDHCRRDVFDEIILKNRFSGIEYYEHLKESRYHKKCSDIDYGYMEVNNSWYIKAHNKELRRLGRKSTTKYSTFDEFMSEIFEDYRPIKRIRFSPGSQYLVEKERCRFYDRSFWKYLMSVFPRENINGGTEAHIVERALWLIFSGFYEQKKF